MLSPRAKRHICRTAFVALCLLASVIVSFAQGENTIIEKCGKLHSQAQMNDCAATEAKKADAALNTTYRELLSTVRENKTATERLVAAEKAWIIFRDAELAAEWPVAEGQNPSILYGSVHPFCFSLELATMTWDRVKTLKDLMQHEEGDVCGSGLARNNRTDEPLTCNSKPERLKTDGRRSGVS